MLKLQRLQILITTTVLAICLVYQSISAVNAFATQPTTATNSPSEQRKTTIFALIEKGEWDTAQAYAQEWIEADKKAAIPLFVIDVAVQVRGEEDKLRRGEYDFPYSDRATMQEVANWARAAAVANPKNVHLATLTAMAYSPAALADADMFVEFLGRAQRLDSNNAFVLQALGVGYGAQAKYDKAIEVLTKAIEMNPKASGAYTNLGVAYLKKGQQTKGLVAMKKAVEVNENDGMAWFNLGSYYAERNRTGEARIPLEKALELRPKLLEARWNLGGVYFNSGERSRAVQQLKEMIKIAPQSPMGRQASGMLRQLGE